MRMSGHNILRLCMCHVDEALKRTGLGKVYCEASYNIQM